MTSRALLLPICLRWVIRYSGIRILSLPKFIQFFRRSTSMHYCEMHLEDTEDYLYLSQITITRYAYHICHHTAPHSQCKENASITPPKPITSHLATCSVIITNNIHTTPHPTHKSHLSSHRPDPIPPVRSTMSTHSLSNRSAMASLENSLMTL